MPHNHHCYWDSPVEGAAGAVGFWFCVAVCGPGCVPLGAPDRGCAGEGAGGWVTPPSPPPPVDPMVPVGPPNLVCDRPKAAERWWGVTTPRNHQEMQNFAPIWNGVRNTQEKIWPCTVGRRISETVGVFKSPPPSWEQLCIMFLTVRITKEKERRQIWKTMKLDNTFNVFAKMKNLEQHNFHFWPSSPF